MVPSRGYRLAGCIAITLFAYTVFAEVKPKVVTSNVGSLSTQEIEEQLQVLDFCPTWRILFH